MLSSRDYLATILDRIVALPRRRIAIAEAYGRVLGETVTARADLPRFDNSAMDGYAVHRDDLTGASQEHPVVLPVVADLPAGFAEDEPLPRGAAARIMTGAPLPTGADAVVPVEDSDAGTETVALTRVPKPGAHIRRRGEELAAGERVLGPGLRLDARAIAAIAAAGYGDVTVAAIPRVVIISTGSELVEPGIQPRRGEIPESNSLMLAGLARDAGAKVVAVIHVRDDPDALRAALARHRTDAAILSGGVSVGAFDVTKAVLAPLPTMSFQTVAIQPGKPQGSGTLADGTLVFALPGNPVSACVSFEVFVRPALAALQGERPRPTVHVIAERDWTSPAGREQYLPVRVHRGVDATLRATPLSEAGSASHLVAGLARAQGLVRVDAERTAVTCGDVLDLIMLTRL